MIDRRNFLLLKLSHGTPPAVLSCETLYMRYLDAQIDGTVDRLWDALRDDLQHTDVVSLIDPSWLADPVLEQQIDRLLDDFRGRGGRVV
jgi:hypothetical protein